MSNLAPSIFEDLEIDTSDMQTDPAAFAARCISAANSLVDILRKDTSIGAYEREVRNRAKDYTPSPVGNEVFEMFDSLLESCETLALEEVAMAIELSRKLTKDLENMLHSRAIAEATSSDSPLEHKKIAHSQHQKLRAAYEAWAKFALLFNNYKAPIMKAQSGNFGNNVTSTTRHIYFVYEDYEGINHYPVIRRLGIGDQITDRMSFIEYVNANPDCGVIMKEYVL